MPLAVSPEKLTAWFVAMFPQVPETESTWLMSERLEAATSVVGLKLAPPQLIQIEPGQGWYSQPNTVHVFRCPQQPRVIRVKIHCLKYKERLGCKVLNILVLEDIFTYLRVCVRYLSKFLTFEVSKFLHISLSVHPIFPRISPDLWLYSSYVAFLYRKRLPQQIGDRR